MIHLHYPQHRKSFDIERTQIVAAPNGVFLRIITKPEELDYSFFAPIRETSRRIENRWQVDGLNCNLSCRNVEFVTVRRRPLTTQLIIDVYWPLNQAIDISFQQYTPSEGVFNEEFAGTARIAERQTGAFSNHGPSRPNQYRPVAVADIPRQMRELVAQDLVPTAQEEIDANGGEITATTLNNPAIRTIVPDISEIPQPPPEPQFLRRFDNMVTDDGMDE